MAEEVVHPDCPKCGTKMETNFIGDKIMVEKCPKCNYISDYPEEKVNFSSDPTFHFQIQPGPRPVSHERCKNCGHEGIYHTHNDHAFSSPRDDSTWCGWSGDRPCTCTEFKGTIIPEKSTFQDIEMELVLRVKHKDSKEANEIVLSKNPAEIMMAGFSLILKKKIMETITGVK